MRPAVHFFTHFHELLARNNSGMAVLHIVLRNNAIVSYTLFIEEIHRVGLLQERIADIFLVREDLLQCTLQPVITSCGSLDAIRFQPLSNLEQACSFQLLSIDSWNDFSFFRDDGQIAFSILGVAEETVVVDLHLSGLVAELQSQLYVLG